MRGDVGTGLGIADDDVVPVLSVVAGGCLYGDGQVFLDQGAVDGPVVLRNPTTDATGPIDGRPPGGVHAYHYIDGGAAVGDCREQGIDRIAEEARVRLLGVRMDRLAAGGPKTGGGIGERNGPSAG